MTLEQLYDFCEGLGPIYQDCPFAKMEKSKPATVTLRHLSNHKIFCFWRTCADGTFELAVKLEPDLAERLREEFTAIRPAWHMNKTHWSDLKLDSDLSDSEILSLVELSYRLTK